ncbi:MAG: hypothetical protein H6739_15265 [Alphaproteobacteria bacterium]|nr:hypothetical protein [Alphaproteobacteria bacterium]
MIPLALLLPHASQAWTVPSDVPHTTGQSGAREVWAGEHVDLLDDALAANGLTLTGRSYTVWTRGGDSTDGLDTLLPPEDWHRAQATQTRLTSLQMWANLPDVSWSVAGWALGNERCPLQEDYSGWAVSESTCFAFLSGWMAALNSHHFVPQSYHAWSWYHELALSNAARCVDLRDTVEALGYEPDSDYGGLLSDVVRECEEESLIFEGVGHHYLQDAWSSGHTWQRWGAPDIDWWKSNATSSNYSALPWAMVVGLQSGQIHGTGYFDDPMCGPHDNIEIVPGGGTAADRIHMVGDYYLDQIGGTDQEQRLQACTFGSLAEVASVLEDGELGLSPSQGVTVTETGCFGQRATNLAWLTGKMTVPDNLPLSVRVAARMGLISEAEFQRIAWRYRLDSVRMENLAIALRWRPSGPNGTDLADLTLTLDDGTTTRLTYVDAQPNDQHTQAIQDGLLTLDPPYAVLVGEDAGTAKQAEDADALRRTFHRAHADYWCADDARFSADVDDETSDLSRIRQVCQTGESDVMTSAELVEDPEDVREAACGLCEEMGLRYHRDGTGADAYNAELEPLCAAFGAERYLYLPVPDGGDRAEVVSDWCRGAPGYAVSSTGVWTFSVGAEPGHFADEATQLSTTPTAANGLAAHAGVVYASTDDALYAITPEGAVNDFKPAGCDRPRGLDVDPDTQVLFAVCEDSDLLASFDLTQSPPALIDTLALLEISDGGSGTIDVVQEPYDVALHPEGFEVAVASDEIYAQQDGVTLVAVGNGVFGDATRIPPQIDSYDFDDFGCRAYCEAAYDPYDPEFYFLYWDCLADCSDHVENIEGLFYASSKGVDYASDGDTLYASNYSTMECLTPSTTSCEIGDHYWVSVAQRSAGQLVADPEVGGRAKAVHRVGDHVLVADWEQGVLYAFSGLSAYDAQLSAGGERPESLAADAAGSRVFVGYDDASSTCGMGVIDSSDEDPSNWSVEALETGLGCVRAVFVPR